MLINWMKVVHCSITPFPESHIGESVSAKRVQWWENGLLAVSEGSLGIIVLSGGQVSTILATRLGVEYPKGMYDVGLPSRKSLFQLQAERILKLQSLALARFGISNSVPWYIMTSESTASQIKKYFEENDFFGISKDDIMFFEQNVVPCFNLEGKILMSDRNRIAYAPNGNGSLFEALRDSKVLSNMESRCLKYLHIHGIDNILIKVGDPLFVGFCIEKQFECGIKVVEKNDPNEHVGVVCVSNGVTSVVEYSEMSVDQNNMRDLQSGRLIYNTGNICDHFLTMEALKKAIYHFSDKLPNHGALKKIPFIDEEGQRNIGVFRVNREDEFSPLKNSDSESTNCPTTARIALSEYHTRLLLSHSTFMYPEYSILRLNHRKKVLVELSPSLTYAGE
ncbi:hypothetical protein MXB_844, partial [Myxobolus squamalis]